MAAPILGRPGISEFPHARHVRLFDWSHEHHSVKLLIDQHGDDAALIEAAVARLERWPKWTTDRASKRACGTRPRPTTAKSKFDVARQMCVLL